MRSDSTRVPDAADGELACGDGDRERALVAAAMAGDGEAIRALWERHRRWIAAVILAHKPSFEDLEDLLQEVAMTFVAKVDTLREETNLRGWLRTVAVNAARAAGRSGRYRPRRALPESDLLGADPPADLGAVHREHCDGMLARLDALPDGYREPLLLRAVNGLRSKQIAEVLDLPPATVDTRIARARRMLREVDEAAGTSEPAAGSAEAPVGANGAAAGMDMKDRSVTIEPRRLDRRKRDVP